MQTISRKRDEKVYVLFVKSVFEGKIMARGGNLGGSFQKNIFVEFLDFEQF
jgi:hypothetical protein